MRPERESIETRCDYVFEKAQPRMSGGAYEYGYQHINDLVDQIDLRTPLRQAFVGHLRLIAQACKAIEWVDSGDLSDGDEDAAILAVIESAYVPVPGRNPRTVRVKYVPATPKEAARVLGEV